MFWGWDKFQAFLKESFLGVREFVAAKVNEVLFMGRKKEGWGGLVEGSLDNSFWACGLVIGGRGWLCF